MKKMLMLLAVAASLIAVAAPGAKMMSLADARAKIGEVIKDPAKMTEIMKKLSSDDQKTFVADVNAAISRMPGMHEERAAMFLNVDKAALRGAAKGNLANIVAEIFSTVPVESLTILSENFAQDLFNRDADPSNPISDELFEKIASDLIATVNERTAKTDDGAVRSALAIAMIVNAANGTMPNLADKLVETLPEDAREKAKERWIPGATKDGEKNYDDLLGENDYADVIPNSMLTLKIAGPQFMDIMLSDFATVATDHPSRTPLLDIVQHVDHLGGMDDDALEGGLSAIPREPAGYQGQTTGYGYSY